MNYPWLERMIKLPPQKYLVIIKDIAETVHVYLKI